MAPSPTAAQPWDGRPLPDTVAVVGSEFAQIGLGVDGTGNGARLRLQDLRTGRVRHLDALELEAVVWLREEHLSSLLDPSADRWREDRDDPPST